MHGGRAQRVSSTGEGRQEGLHVYTLHSPCLAQIQGGDLILCKGRNGLRLTINAGLQSLVAGERGWVHLTSSAKRTIWVENVGTVEQPERVIQ
jgi:hypothetical protein